MWSKYLHSYINNLDFDSLTNYMSANRLNQFSIMLSKFFLEIQTYFENSITLDQKIQFVGFWNWIVNFNQTIA